MSKIHTEISKIKSEKPLNIALGILVGSFVGWLTFALGAWNQNLLITILGWTILTVLARYLFERKMMNLLEDLGFLISGVFLWNHMVIAFTIFFVLKVVWLDKLIFKISKAQ